MEVVILASIKVARAGLYVGSFQICDIDGNVLDSFEKPYHRQPMSAVIYNLGGILWDRFKQNEAWAPIDFICDYPAHVPNFIRKRVAALFDSGRLDHMSEINKLETEAIEENLFEAADEFI